MFYYDEPVPFTHESRRGRIRTCRGVGISLPEAEVLRFDQAHEAMPRKRTTKRFTVRHRIQAHFFTVQVTACE